MFDRPYPFEKAGKTSTLLRDPVEKVYYRFQAAHRKYLVTLEVFSTGMAAVKFCDIKQRENATRFNHIYNDGDAFRVITTCLHIMLDYWRRNPAASFCFYGIPKDIKADSPKVKQLDAEAAELYLERQRSTRFTIYSYAMVNLFDPEYFRQMRDSANYFYILMNRQQPEPTETMEKLGAYLLEHYEMIFEEDALE